MKLKRITSQSVKNKIFSRSGMIIIAVCAVLLMTGAFILWSKYTWDTYQTRYEGWRTSTMDQTRSALALPATNDQERQAKFTALKKISNDTTTAKKSLCKVNNLIGWQRFIEKQRNREHQCQAMLDDFATFSEKLKVTVLYLENEQALVKIISEAPIKTELKEADLASVAAGWHVVVGKVDALSVESNFTPTKQAARDVMAKLDTAWQELLAAHNAKDKARYTQAQNQLVQNYSTLGTITDVSAGQLKALTDSLQTTFESL